MRELSLWAVSSPVGTPDLLEQLLPRMRSTFHPPSPCREKYLVDEQRQRQTFINTYMAPCMRTLMKEFVGTNSAAGQQGIFSHQGTLCQPGNESFATIPVSRSC